MPIIITQLSVCIVFFNPSHLKFIDLVECCHPCFVIKIERVWLNVFPSVFFFKYHVVYLCRSFYLCSSSKTSQMKIKMSFFHFALGILNQSIMDSRENNNNTVIVMTVFLQSFQDNTYCCNVIIFMRQIILRPHPHIPADAIIVLLL